MIKKGGMMHWDLAFWDQGVGIESEASSSYVHHFNTGLIPYVDFIFSVFYFMYNLFFFESENNDIVQKLDIGPDTGTRWD